MLATISWIPYVLHLRVRDVSEITIKVSACFRRGSGRWPRSLRYCWSRPLRGIRTGRRRCNGRVPIAPLRASGATQRGVLFRHHWRHISRGLERAYSRWGGGWGSDSRLRRLRLYQRRVQVASGRRSETIHTASPAKRRCCSSPAYICLVTSFSARPSWLALRAAAIALALGSYLAAWFSSAVHGSDGLTALSMAAGAATCCHS